MSRLPDIYDWLREGVPLTLLIDLLDPAGPASAAILTGESADVSWIAAAS